MTLYDVSPLLKALSYQKRLYEDSHGYEHGKSSYVRMAAREKGRRGDWIMKRWDGLYHTKEPRIRPYTWVEFQEKKMLKASYNQVVPLR